MHRLLLACSALVATAPLATFAAPPALSPGKYTVEGGGGVLQLKGRPDGALEFDLDTALDSGNECSLSGAIPKGATRSALAVEGLGKCVVQFTPTARGVSVSVAEGPEACSGFCGAGATFEDEFVRAPSGCSPDEVEAARKRFKELYQRKAYADARITLDRLLTGCASFLSDSTQGSVRNDLAVTLHHLGKDPECLAALAPLRELAATSDAEIAESYAYSEVEAYQRLASATRYNLRLCGEK
jgi:hypothetical protein